MIAEIAASAVRQMGYGTYYGISYADFVAAYPFVDWRRALVALGRGDWYGIGFAFRVRCPDGVGRFGAGYGRWVAPWRWHRAYWAARVAA